MKALYDDMFPSSQEEGLFGVGPATPLGKTIYGCWKTMHILEMCDPESIVEALHNGQMPLYFEDQVRSIERIATEKGMKQVKFCYFQVMNAWIL